MLYGGILKPNHRLIRAYHSELDALVERGVSHEMGLRPAFQRLLTDSARLHNWSLIAEQTLRGRVRSDATLRDQNNLPRGYWEAKDSQDRLDVEIAKKRAKGYPVTNIIFENTQPRHCIWIPNGPNHSEDDTECHPHTACTFARRSDLPRKLFAELKSGLTRKLAILRRCTSG